ncbi:hypothetical protein B0T10DRAFT_607986 [Thelonectria olida]|uniref:Uncharacterized protein n=1 Tax=Thelonectria olida TaxID=1576542 RepID=A0A9P8W2M2_9HYPO|nr:hypothetical protein B0T10DRAFT_607986 [Thelonectria olida]
MSPKRRISHIFRTRQHRGKPESITITARAPVPLDPAKAQLPDLVVRRILTFLHEMSPEELCKIASLSSSLYIPARYTQHAHVHIDLDKSRHVLDRLQLITRLGQLAAIRTLEVKGYAFDHGDNKSSEILARLDTMVRAMTGLRRLDWHVSWTEVLWTGELDSRRRTSVPIPMPILAALPAELCLYTSVTCHNTTESHAQAREFLRRLAGNQSLRVLSIKAVFIEEQVCLELMRPLKKVLLSCPNLTRIPNMNIWYLNEGCEGYGPPGSNGLYCGLGLTDSDKPLALEELGIEHYPWGVPAWRGYPAKGYPFEWNFWAEELDWSRLVRLHDAGHPLFQSLLAPKLTALKELLLEDFSWLEADFIQDITAPLELLSLSTWNRVNSKPDLIDRFGTTLRHLKMHQPEHSWNRADHTFVTTPDVVHLSKSLPHLEHLALDIRRDEDRQEWPYEMLDAISAFPRLATVELWFPLGRERPAPTPLLTAASARHLFRYMRERNENIKKVMLHSGAPVPSIGWTWMGAYNDEPTWAMHSTISLVCNMVYNGEGPEEEGGGWISVSCPDMTADMNRQLHRMSQQTDRELPDPVKLNRAELRLRVALDGPLDEAGWRAWENKNRPRNESREEEKPMLQRLVVGAVGPLKRALKR